MSQMIMPTGEFLDLLKVEASRRLGCSVSALSVNLRYVILNSDNAGFSYLEKNKIGFILSSTLVSHPPNDNIAAFGYVCSLNSPDSFFIFPYSSLGNNTGSYVFFDDISLLEGASDVHHLCYLEFSTY